MKRIVDTKEALNVLIAFAFCQIFIAGLVFSLPFHLGGSLTETIASSTKLPDWEIALLYIGYISISGFILWLILKRLNFRNLIFQLIEVLLISLAFGILLSIFIPILGDFAYLIGLAIALIKLKFPVLRNICAIIIGVAGGLALALFFSFPLMLLIVVGIAVYDYIAVYVTKHMTGIAGIAQEIQSSFLLSFSRKIDDVGEGTISRVSLGTGDLMFASALVASALLSYQNNFGIMLAVLLIIGNTIAMAWILLTLKATLKAMPAIPPIAIASMMVFILSVIVVII